MTSLIRQMMLQRDDNSNGRPTLSQNEPKVT